MGGNEMEESGSERLSDRPTSLGRADGLMVSTGEIGSHLSYLDRISEASPSLFAVIARVAPTQRVGEEKKRQCWGEEREKSRIRWLAIRST